MKITNVASTVPLTGPAPTEDREIAHTAQAQTPQPSESTLNHAIDQAVQLFDHVISAMKGPEPGLGSKDIQKAKDALEEKGKDLQSEDKLGNFKIQELMSHSDQFQESISNILKKEGDTASGITQNLK